MKYAEIQALSTEELKEKVNAERVTLQKLNFAHAVTPLENPNKIRESRKAVAQMLTELRKRELANVKK